MSYPTIDSTILFTLANGGFKKSPSFNNKKQKPAAGRGLYTVILQPFATWKFSGNCEFMTGVESQTTDQYALLVGLFMNVCGGGAFWFFNDVNDNTVTQQTSCMLDVTANSTTPIAQTGNGTSTQFQLARLIGGQGIDILQNVNGITVYVNGAMKTAGADYGISATGVITFTSAPANGATLTWSGSFVYLCLFDEDTMDDLALVAFNATDALHSVTSLKFESVLL